jgi:hypothetical protein
MYCKLRASIFSDFSLAIAALPTPSSIHPFLIFSYWHNTNNAIAEHLSVEALPPVYNASLSEPLAPESLGSVVIRLSITEAASTISFLRNDGASTFARIESAAPGSTISIRSAFTSDELCSSAVASALVIARSSFSSNRLLDGLFCTCACLLSQLSCRRGWKNPLVCGSIAASQGLSSVVVGLTITESTPAIPFQRDDGASTLPCVEATTARCTISIGGTIASDELGALCSNIERKAQEGSDFEDRCHRGIAKA